MLKLNLRRVRDIQGEELSFRCELLEMKRFPRNHGHSAIHWNRQDFIIFPPLPSRRKEVKLFHSSRRIWDLFVPEAMACHISFNVLQSEQPAGYALGKSSCCLRLSSKNGRAVGAATAGSLFLCKQRGRKALGCRASVLSHLASAEIRA